MTPAQMKVFLDAGIPQAYAEGKAIQKSMEPIHLLSLGAGVQSSTMALMAAHGEISPMPTAAIFADTQSEPKSVYEWLDWLEKQLPFPVHRVTAGSLEESAIRVRRSAKSGNTYLNTGLPVYFANAGLGKRECTLDFKINPIRKKLRELANGQPVIQWIGISSDEIVRVKPSRDRWCENRWPLIELRMSRQSCMNWMERNKYPPPPRSACVFCPYHSNAEWRRLQTQEQEEFALAVEFEKQLQAAASEATALHCKPFLHKSCKPLDTVDFRSDIERGQGVFDWQDECEGMCGV